MPNERSIALSVLAWPAFKDRRVNPYTSLLYGAVSARGPKVYEFTWPRSFWGRFDVFHVHWPEAIANSGGAVYCGAKLLLFAVLLGWLKVRGTRVVWTVHNLRPHEERHPRLQRVFRRFFFRLIDGHISLSRTGQAEVLRMYPELRAVRGFVIPHGPYSGEYPNTLTREEARNELGIPADAFAYLCLGQIRRYRNVPELIRAFRSIANKNAVLIVVGICSDMELREQILRLAEADDRVTVKLAYIPAESVQVFMNAADVVVQPYRNILNSGSALLALSFERPVIVPDKGAMTELRERFGEKWVICYQGAVSAEILSDGAIGAKTLSIVDREDLQQKLGEISWKILAETTMAAYSELRSR